ncbi:unnamed protein product, partial [Prorocentrum cordatum]
MPSVARLCLIVLAVDGLAQPLAQAAMDGPTMMMHFREMLRSGIKEPMANDFADVKTSIDNVHRDVERHEGRLNNMEQEIKDLREGRWAAPSSTAASSVGHPLPFSGVESTAAQPSVSGPKRAHDKICVIIGGWDRGAPRDTILNEARAFTDAIPDKAEDGVFAPLKRASFLKVRFTSSGRMWAWVRSMKGKQIIMPQPHHLGRRFWFSVEKSSEEIRLSMIISRAKKELTDNLGAQAADLELDYIRGIIWWKQHRLGEMARTTGLMSFKEHVAADISAHTGVHFSLVEPQESEEQMCFKLISWNAQGVAKHSAEYVAATPREQHDYDVGDLYLVTPRAEGQKQMGLLVRSRARRSLTQCADSMEALSDLIMMAPPGAHPIAGAGAQTASPPPQADEERWIGDFPVGQRTRRAEIPTRLLMQHDLAATKTFTAAASGPTCHYDFKHPPAQIDYVLTPARDIWKVSATLEEITDSAQSDHSAIKLEFTLGTMRRYIWNGGRAPMKGWTCLDNRSHRWSHSACCADRNPAPITSMADAAYLAAAARGRGPPARKVPKLPEGRELTQTLRVLGVRRRITRDRVQRAIYSKDIIRIRRMVWTANRALQHCLHEDDPLRIKELLELEHGNTFRASDGEEPVGASTYPTHCTTEDALDTPPFSPEMLREAPCDMKATKAPGVDGVVAEVLQDLDSGFLASLAAVFENPRGWHAPPSGLTWGTTALDHEFGDYQMRVEDGALTRTPREEGRPCLGSVCTVDGRSWKDTQHRVARAWRAFYALKMFLPGPAGLWQQATKLFERAIKPVVLYGSESRCPAVK